MKKLFSSFFRKVTPYNQVNASKNIHSFTYYISGPPERKSGYREKQFDYYFKDILSYDVEILSLNTQTHSGVNQSGMWVILIVNALTAEANAELSNFDKNQEIKKNLLEKNINDNLDAEDIKGLYQIHD